MGRAGSERRPPTGCGRRVGARSRSGLVFTVTLGRVRRPRRRDDPQGHQRRPARHRPPRLGVRPRSSSAACSESWPRVTTPIGRARRGRSSAASRSSRSGSSAPGSRRRWWCSSRPGRCRASAPARSARLRTSPSGAPIPAELQPRMFAVLSTAWVVPGLIGPAISGGGRVRVRLALGVPRPAAPRRARGRDDDAARCTRSDHPAATNPSTAACDALAARRRRGTRARGRIVALADRRRARSSSSGAIVGARAYIRLVPAGNGATRPRNAGRGRAARTPDLRVLRHRRLGRVHRDATCATRAS